MRIKRLNGTIAEDVMSEGQIDLLADVLACDALHYRKSLISGTFDVEEPTIGEARDELKNDGFMRRFVKNAIISVALVMKPRETAKQEAV